jgi:hypothetical protein
MTGRPERPRSGSVRRERAARNAQSKAYINLAKALAAVFSAGVYSKEDLQSAVCTYVSEMKEAGETGEGVVRAAQSMVHEIGPASRRQSVPRYFLPIW